MYQIRHKTGSLMQPGKRENWRCIRFRYAITKIYFFRNIRVTDSKRKELFAYRNKLQRQAILDCNNLLALIGLARPLYHLKGKKVKYWSEKTLKTRNYIKKWKESDQNRYS